MKKLLTLFLVLLLSVLMFPAYADLEVHFLNIGPGSCTILTCDGESMIVNGGPAEKSDMIFATLRDVGIDDLKYVIATGTDDSQVGGLPAALHAATVHSIYAPVAECDAERFTVLTETAFKKGLAVSVPFSGEVFHLGRAKLTITANAQALALRVQYGDSILLISPEQLITPETASGASTIQITDGIVGAPESHYHGYVILNQEHNKDITEAFLEKGITPIWTEISGRTTFTADGKVDYISAENQFIANKNTETVHRANCSYVALIKPMHYASLFTIEQANRLEYAPCKHCKPW